MENTENITKVFADAGTRGRYVSEFTPEQQELVDKKREALNKRLRDEAKFASITAQYWHGVELD